MSAEFGCCADGTPEISDKTRKWMESFTTNKNRYLNSGMVTGRVSTFRRIYPFGMTKFNEDDQNAMIKYWEKNPSDIVLDYDERLFSNGNWSPKHNGYALGNGQWMSKHTCNTPIFIQTQAKNWTLYKKLLSIHRQPPYKAILLLCICIILRRAMKSRTLKLF